MRKSYYTEKAKALETLTKQAMDDLRGIDYCDNRFHDRVRIIIGAALNIGATNAMLGDWGGEVWHVDLDRGNVCNDQGDVLWSFPHSASAGISDFANARLAAHAPELVEELRRLVKRCERLPDLCPDQAGMLEHIAEEARRLLDRIYTPLQWD